MTIKLPSTFAALVALSMLVAPPALAKQHGHHRADTHWEGNARNRSWDAADSYRAGGKYKSRRLARGDEIYRGHDGRYYCRRSDGTTGLVIGAIAGGLLGNAIGGNQLSALLGAGGGALLGRSIDRGQVRCR